MTTKKLDLEKYRAVEEQTFFRKLGKVVNVVGLTIESVGPDARLGDVCRIVPDTEETEPVLAEVVGFRDTRTLLMPLDQVEGIRLGCSVENTGYPLTVTVSEELLGKTVNGLGLPVDGSRVRGGSYSVEAPPPDPLRREIIDTVLHTDGYVCPQYQGGYQCDRADRRAWP